MKKIQFSQREYFFTFQFTSGIFVLSLRLDSTTTTRGLFQHPRIDQFIEVLNIYNGIFSSWLKIFDIADFFNLSVL